jgi:phosphoserine phosphatase
VLLKPLCEDYGVTLLASKFNLETGKFEGPLCVGPEKVRRLSELGISECDEFYTDSFTDAPIIKLSRKAFMVDGNRVKLIWSKKEKKDN